MLALDAAGFLWAELTSGTLTQIAQGITPNARAKSTTLFGREYLAISDGKFGNDMPRQYDATHFDRVSQCGPGAGPSIVDANVEPTHAIGASPTGAIRANNISTVTTTVAHGYQIGQTVLIVNIADATFNGTFLVTGIPTATSFTYSNAGGTSASGDTGAGASVTMLPQVAPGVHQVSVIFQTRQGYLTAPSPPIPWTAGGGRRASVTNIPTGPPNIVARILAFTGANGDSFFYVPTNIPQASGMLIADNTTTSITLDFSDAALLAGANVDDLFKLLELGECAGVIDYSSRLFWWGERAKIDNFLNLTFDGGFDPTNIIPLGWTHDPTFGPGGQASTSSLWGGAYLITGPPTGGNSNRGMITQSAYRDANSVPILQGSTQYSVRLRARHGAGLGPAQLTVDISSPSLGILALATVSNLQLTSVYQEFIVPFQQSDSCANSTPDAQLRVYVAFEDLPATSESALIDCIEIFPTAQPVNLAQVRASYAEDPESYDGITGILSVAEENGQAVRAAFKLREQLYFVKEHSFYTTQDDGVNEPDKWTLSQISNLVGTPSVNGVDTGEDWAVIAAREGLYLFGGGEPVKISQEIQAHVGSNQLAIRPHALGSRGRAQQTHSSRRSVWNWRHATESYFDDGLSRNSNGVANFFRRTGAIQHVDEKSFRARYGARVVSVASGRANRRANRATRRHVTNVFGKCRRQRKNLSVQRRATERRRRRNKFLLHDGISVARRSGSHAASTLAQKTFRVSNGKCGRRGFAFADRVSK